MRLLHTHTRTITQSHNNYTNDHFEKSTFQNESTFQNVDEQEQPFPPDIFVKISTMRTSHRSSTFSASHRRARFQLPIDREQLSRFYSISARTTLTTSCCILTTVQLRRRTIVRQFFARTTLTTTQSTKIYNARCCYANSHLSFLFFTTFSTYKTRSQLPIDRDFPLVSQ